MVWVKRAPVQITVGAAQPPPKPANSPTQIATIIAKKTCPRDACAIVAQAGVTNFTATPPRPACTSTTMTAAQANFAEIEVPLPDGRGSDWQAEACPTQIANPTVSKPTSIAATRCANSYRIPPSSVGTKRPHESGQSGTESAASLLVTSPPAITSPKVQHATNTA